jgi:hypothetical protein
MSRPVTPADVTGQSTQQVFGYSWWSMPSIMDALTFLDESLDVVASSPDLVGDSFVVEVIDRRTYGEAPRSGLSFIVDDDGRIRTVHLHAEGHEGHAAYLGVIPLGVRFDMSRAEVRSVLGSPTASGEAHQIEGYGEGPAWDLFDLAGAQMHVEYAKDQRSIRLVTLSRRGSR